MSSKLCQIWIQLDIFDKDHFQTHDNGLLYNVNHEKLLSFKGFSDQMNKIEKIVCDLSNYQIPENSLVILIKTFGTTKNVPS